ncbi:hypothetical protein [Methanobacterium paludis]|uniref:Uncharacterized protein n=1 Tax=Methanobacterium paludis (strain DSM 25820 / JCM 18151 / SWAN1) TaxID=868131 RepID=F6D2U2_METPW|nr:hypothetical protein [Methanobacterium paludis]AEG18671.1 hypothetical protein MSWAN_1660 [Methanobacterium paludis]
MTKKKEVKCIGSYFSGCEPSYMEWHGVTMSVSVFDTESTYKKIDGVWYLKKVYKHKPRVTEAYVRVTNALGA